MRVYGDRDVQYQQRIERERIGLTGVQATYYRLKRAANVDPLYNEPCVWDFEEFCMTVAIEFISSCCASNACSPCEMTCG